ncbi:MAG TPA: hypothetical protein VFJ19_12830 [Nocardioidaceae bacterium]|nr:hypothetical protein [Nocardioidaceae bacterium]
MRSKSDLLMLSGRMAECPDCGEQRLFLPVDRPDSGEFCCTGCDAAVYMSVMAEWERWGTAAEEQTTDTRRGVA